MAFLTIESGKTGKDVNVLVVTDHLTWYAQAFVTPSHTAQVVAQTLWISSLCTMVSLRKFPVTKGTVLKVDS